MKLRSSFLTIIFITLGCSCNNVYKAGNLIDLSYPIETRLSTTVVRRYIDTLIEFKGFAVPEKWQQFDKLVNLDSTDNKRIYFQSNPEEMYLISYQGMLILSDVYNPKINGYGWVAKRERISKTDEERVKNRFQYEILDKIDRMAHDAGLPDSIIYKNSRD